MAPHGEISFEQALNQGVLILHASAGNPAWRKLPDSVWGGAQFAISGRATAGAAQEQRRTWSAGLNPATLPETSLGRRSTSP